VPIGPLVREDIESQEISGLIRALDSFKPHLAIPSRLHTHNWMLGYLSCMYDRNGDRTPWESARRILAKYRECKSNFSAKHSRPPTLRVMVEQLAAPSGKGFFPLSTWAVQSLVSMP